MSVEYLVLSAICFLLGAGGALLISWSIQARLYGLEDRISLVEGSLLREVKSRAASERWKKSAIEDEAITAALATSAPASPRKPKWFEAVVKEKNGSVG